MDILFERFKKGSIGEIGWLIKEPVAWAVRGTRHVKMLV